MRICEVMIMIKDACRNSRNSAGMVVNKILYLNSALILTNLCVVANDSVADAAKCQFGMSMRKQMPAEPLNGMCLRDIVVHLSKTLQSIVDEELGTSSFQEMIDKMEFVNVSINLDEKLSALVDKFDNKLKSYINIFKQVYKVINRILARNLLPAIYSSQMIDYDMMENKVSDICTDIMKELTTQLRGQEWKSMHILPINKPDTMCGLPILTHNIGPLLLSQYCPEKNVILLLEHGTFMSESELALAQITAKTIIDMLSETDNITVVGLANTAPLLCKDSLLKATDVNKFQLTRYIDSLTRTDSNEVTKIDFKKLTQNLIGEVLIIHLTNRLQNTSNVQKIFEIISEKFKAYLKTIIVTDHQSPIVIKKLSNDSIIILPTQNVFGYEIGKLFSCLQCPDYHKKDFYISDPYIEPYSKAMTISIGQITKTALLSLDIKLRDFLDDVMYFNIGPNVYSIFFDSKGIVWMHKNFPRIETIVEQPLKVHLQDIENIDSQTVLKMINEIEGVMVVKTKLDEQKQFRWKHLIYDDLIICLVSTTEEGILLPVARIVPPLPANILHHRLDLMLQTIVDKNTLCIYRNKIVTLSTGVIYLSPWCFQSPMEQLKLLETGSAVNVQSYMAYIKDLTGLLANPGLHSSVKSDVATLAQILEHFRKQHVESSLNKFIIRRYIVSTVSGVLEIFPGMVLDSGFDPKRRMWYRKALEQPDKTILTPPYLDAGGSGYIVTLSQTVKYFIGANKSTGYVIAVLSMDVTMGYIMRLLLEMFPFCHDTTVKCFLMDDKGYLVSHPKLLEAIGKIEQQHLTHKELLVANDILNHGLFVKKKACASHLDGTVQRYYQFNMSLDEVLTNIAHGEHCVKYQVATVPSTNVFLGVVNMTTQCNLLRAFCPCSTMDHSCLNCKSMEQTGCECPCECSLYSSSCMQQDIDNLDSCPPIYEQGSNLQTPWIESMNLKSCPSINCKLYTTKRDCLGVVDCQWCYIDTDGETPLQQPFCSDMSICFKGIFGSLIPYSDNYNSHSTDEIAIREWPSVGPVAGGILALFLILGVILFCYRLRSVHSGLEHQCLHLHTSPDTLRMTHIEGDPEPAELDQTKNNLDCLVRDSVAPISPYRVSTNYRRPPGGDSDHGYSTMTPHDDSEQQTFASEPLLAVDNNVESDLIKQSGIGVPSPITYLGSPHHVLASVTVHRDMETNYC